MLFRWDFRLAAPIGTVIHRRCSFPTTNFRSEPREIAMELYSTPFVFHRSPTLLFTVCIDCEVSGWGSVIIFSLVGVLNAAFLRGDWIGCR
jgi:hypothetical protein